MANKVLVIVAHPDDEVLGCGGTIYRHILAGDEVRLLIMSSGVGSRKHSNEIELANRKQAALDAAKILGIQDTYFFDFPDNAMDSIPILEIIKSIELILDKYAPNIIYTHHFGDLNIDHRITCMAVLTACRPLPGSLIQSIYSFEIPSSTNFISNQPDLFIPNTFIDISAVWDKKVDALRCYDFEMRPFPHARSERAIEAQAISRGCSVGLKKAEAFSLHRRVIFND